MKKIFILMSIIFLASCSKNIEIEKTDNDMNTNTNTISNSEITSYEGIATLTPEEIQEYREEILPEDIDLLRVKSDTKNPLLIAGKQFMSDLENTTDRSITQSIDGGIEYSDYKKLVDEIPEELTREFNLQLNIVDSESGENIHTGKIFINGVKFGEFKEGRFNKKFVWPKGIEKFDMVIRTDNYRDSFITLSSLGLEGSLLLAEAQLQKLDINKKISLDKDQVIKQENFSMKIPYCSLVDVKGECYDGEVTVKIDFISGSNVNAGDDRSLNMQAITSEGEIVSLASGGMAFTDFITPDGEILSVKKDKEIEITYKVSDEEIQTMKSTLMSGGKDLKDGYWVYDKNINLWRESEAKIILDEENKTWTAIVSDIY